MFEHRHARCRTMAHQTKIVAVVWVVLLTCCAPPEDGSYMLRLNEVMAGIERDYPTLHHVGPDQVEQWMGDSSASPLLLDVRKTEEFEVSHLDGAVNVNPSASAESLADTVLEGVDKGRRIVTYCAVGMRSARLAQRLQEAGYTNVHNLNGSIFLWANEGKPLYRGQSPVHTVHPFDRKWGKLLKRELHADGVGE